MSKERVHILGICGTFMGGLALMGKEKGIDISGCDENIYPPMSDHLQEMGIEIIEGYDSSELPVADYYVIGNSISRGNLALEYLLSKKSNLISGPEWLYDSVIKDKKVIAVSGTHGKTTTTAMIAWISEDNNIDVGYLIAGKPKDFEKSARLGSEDIFVIEADEYDTAFFDKRSKFIHYKPDTLVLNNLEFDHADIFPDITYIFREFHHLLRTLNKEAQIIFPNDDSNSVTLDKSEILGSLKRISIYANKTTNQVRFKISGSEILISAEDLDFSNEANERISCDHDGDDIEIGFNAKFLIEMLSNIESEKVLLKLSEPNKAGLLIPENMSEKEDIIMLVMPVMLNDNA